MILRDKFFRYILIFLVLFTAGCFEDREHMWDHEVLEWEPPDPSTNALDMTVNLEDDETEPRVVSLRLQYAGPHKSEDMTGTFVIDEQNSEAVEGEHYRILNESNSVTIPAGSSYSEEIEIEIISGDIERGEELGIVLLITSDGDIPPMENYKEFNLFIAKETGFLPVEEFTISDPGSNSGQRVVDLTTVTTYTTLEGDNNPGIQAQIDFGGWNSSSTDHTIMIPTDSDRLGGWGSGRRIRDDWVNKNDGIIMKLPLDAENEEMFNNILLKEDLIEAYEDAEQYLTDNLDLDPDDYGPGGHLQYVKTGELIFFQSLDRGFYAVLYVTEHVLDDYTTYSVKTTWEEEED